MSEPDRSREDADLEALLRATFLSEARGRVSDARPVPTLPEPTRLATVHPVRRRWMGISVVAAALVAVVVGATVFGNEVMDSDRTPTPPGTSVAPAPTTAAPSASPTTPRSSPTTPGTTAASTPVAAPTRQLAVEGVTLTVPTTWGVQPLAPAPDYGYSRTCVVDGPSPTPIDYAANRCALVVFVGADPTQQPFGSQNYDVALSSACGERSAALDPLSEDAQTIDGRDAEHRRWSSPCLPSSSIETWTVSTWPLVQFTRVGDASDPATVAAVDGIVAGASLPNSISSMRAIELGYPTTVDANTVSVDRVTVVGTTVTNDNPATYDYPIAADARIVGETSGSPRVAEMTLDLFRDEVAGRTVGNFLPVDQLYVYIQTDGHQATFVALRLRSQLS